MIISISDPAKEYLAELLAKQGVEGIGIRVFVSQPGSSHAETCIVYCKPGDEELTDIEVDYDLFKAYIDKPSVPYLEESEVDFAKDKMGGQLTIKAPHAKVPNISDDSPLPDRINYILYNEVNPALAAHGGIVSLVELLEDNVAILQFGGGCQGCGMVDVTLKEGVEKTLLDSLPELKGVKDVTDHTDRENAYYK